MATSIIMPKAGVAMEEGTVIRWLKHIGDKVSTGEPLLEIETDKVSMEVEAETDGYLIATLAEPGQTLPVVTTIGYIGEKGEEVPKDALDASGVSKGASPAPESAAAHGAAQNTDQSATQSGSAEPATAPESRQNVMSRTVPATPAARRVAAQHNIDIAAIPAGGSHGEIRVADVDAVLASSGAPGAPVASTAAASVAATPLARKVAQAHGVDLHTVHPEGRRIHRQDVEDHLSGGSARHPAGDHPAGDHPAGDHPAGDHPASDHPVAMPSAPQSLRGMRKVIAQRLTEAHHQIPPVTLTRPVLANAMLQLRSELNEYQEDVYFSVNHILSYATVRALKHFPQLNATFENDLVHYSPHINVGIAVSVSDGLLVPVMHHAEQKTFTEFTNRLTLLTTQARVGELPLDALQGGTFTITNLGMYGITHFTPIINRPQIAILGLCAPQKKVSLSSNGHLMEKTLINLALTIDHRILDGAIAAQFLQELAAIIEKPAQLLL